MVLTSHVRGCRSRSDYGGLFRVGISFGAGRRSICGLPIFSPGSSKCRFSSQRRHQRTHHLPYGNDYGFARAGSRKPRSRTASRLSTAADPKISLLYGIWGWFFLGAAARATMAFHFQARGLLAVVLALLGLIARSL